MNIKNGYWCDNDRKLITGIYARLCLHIQDCDANDEAISHITIKQKTLLEAVIMSFEEVI